MENKELEEQTQVLKNKIDLLPRLSPRTNLGEEVKKSK
jgi:hypothetical protein